MFGGNNTSFSEVFPQHNAQIYRSVPAEPIG